MKKERFQELIDDKTVIKFNEWEGRYFIYNKAKLVVGFFFMHKGYPKYSFSEPDRRIILSVFPLHDLNIDIPMREIQENTYFMVNSSYYEYALTFILQIDEINQKVKVKIKDFPELGKDIISQEEKDGLEKDIK